LSKPSCFPVIRKLLENCYIISLVKFLPRWTYYIEHENVLSLQGQQIDFVKADENSRKWLNEFRTKPFSVPGKLENVDGEHL